MEISAPTIVESNKRDIPLSVRFLDRFSSPITVTLAAAVILTAGYLAGESLTGGLHPVLTGAQDSLGLRATATLFVLAAYAPLPTVICAAGLLSTWPHCTPHSAQS
jgi:hypothetical protein